MGDAGGRDPGSPAIDAAGEQFQPRWSDSISKISEGAKVTSEALDGARGTYAELEEQISRMVRPADGGAGLPPGRADRAVRNRPTSSSACRAEPAAPTEGKETMAGTSEDPALSFDPAPGAVSNVEPVATNLQQVAQRIQPDESRMALLLGRAETELLREYEGVV